MQKITIERTTAPKAKPTDETKLGFGKIFTDHMFICEYENGEWVNYTVHVARPGAYRIKALYAYQTNTVRGQRASCSHADSPRQQPQQPAIISIDSFYPPLLFFTNIFWN